MSMGQTGITAASAGRRLLGDGAVYLDYDGAKTRLGATRGGGEFNPNREIAAPDVDGAIADVAGWHRVRRVDPTLKVTLLEMTVENLMRVIAGANSSPASARVHVDAEYVGEGDDVTVQFSLDHTDVIQGSLKVYVDSVLQTEGGAGDYTVNYGTGVITFNSAPASAEKITADYTYDAGGAATHDIITGGQIELSDYLTDVAWSGTTLDSNEDMAFVLKRVIALELSPIAFGGDDVALEVTFHATADPADPLNEALMYEIRRPRAS